MDHTLWSNGFIQGMQVWFNISQSINMMDYVNELKDKNHIDHPTEAEKKLMWNSTSIYYKTINKVGLEVIWLNIIMAIHDKTTAKVLLNGEKLKAFPWRSGTRHGWSFLTILFKIMLEVIDIHSSQKRKKINKWNPNWKSKTVTLCRWHDTI